MASSANSCLETNPEGPGISLCGLLSDPVGISWAGSHCDRFIFLSKSSPIALVNVQAKLRFNRQI